MLVPRAQKPSLNGSWRILLGKCLGWIIFWCLPNFVPSRFSTIHEGGDENELLFPYIPADWLRVPTAVPQVQLRASNILAAQRAVDSTNFQFSEKFTPVVKAIGVDGGTPLNGTSAVTVSAGQTLTVRLSNVLLPDLSLAMKDTGKIPAITLGEQVVFTQDGVLARNGTSPPPPGGSSSPSAGLGDQMTDAVTLTSNNNTVYGLRKTDITIRVGSAECVVQTHRCVPFQFGQGPIRRLGSCPDAEALDTYRDLLVDAQKTATNANGTALKTATVHPLKDFWFADEYEVTCVLQDGTFGTDIAPDIAVGGQGYADTSFVTVDFALELHSVYPLAGSLAGGTEIDLTGYGLRGVRCEDVAIGEGAGTIKLESTPTEMRENATNVTGLVYAYTQYTSGGFSIDRTEQIPVRNLNCRVPYLGSQNPCGGNGECAVASITMLGKKLEDFSFDFLQQYTPRVVSIEPRQLAFSYPGLITINFGSAPNLELQENLNPEHDSSFDYTDFIVVDFVESLNANQPKISRNCLIAETSATQLKCRLARDFVTTVYSKPNLLSNPYDVAYYRPDAAIYATKTDYLLKPRISVKPFGYASLSASASLDTSAYITSVTPSEKLGFGGGTPTEIRGFGFLGGLGVGSTAVLRPGMGFAERRALNHHSSAVPSVAEVQVFLNVDFSFYYRGRDCRIPMY